MEIFCGMKFTQSLREIEQLAYIISILVAGCCYWVESYKASQALRPFADLLCVPIWTIILLIHPPVLSGCTRTKEVARNVLEFCRRSISFMLSNVLLHAIKTYDKCPPALLPIRRKACCGLFIAIKNPSPWPGLNPRPLGPETSSLTTSPPKRLHNIDTRNWIREQTVIHATRW
jgi:hypothetical protein